jgi:hypothetical protein
LRRQATAPYISRTNPRPILSGDRLRLGNGGVTRGTCRTNVRGQEPVGLFQPRPIRQRCARTEAIREPTVGPLSSRLEIEEGKRDPVPGKRTRSAIPRVVTILNQFGQRERQQILVAGHGRYRRGSACRATDAEHVGPGGRPWAAGAPPGVSCAPRGRGRVGRGPNDVRFAWSSSTADGRPVPGNQPDLGCAGERAGTQTSTTSVS